MQTLAIIDTQYQNLIKACDTNIEIKVLKKDCSFQNFLKKEMQLYRHYNILIIDRNILTETDDELLELIKQFRMIYPKVKLIFIYPNAEKINPAFIQSILFQDIFNIITAQTNDKQETELSDCLSDRGMDALKWIRLFPELISSDDKHKKNEKKNILSYKIFHLEKKYYIAAICVLLFSCAGFFTLKNISNNNVVLSVGGSHTISAIITPSNAQDKTVTWSSNKGDIATVDSNGTIRATGTGKAIITATTRDGGLSASCMVTVN